MLNLTQKLLNILQYTCIMVHSEVFFTISDEENDEDQNGLYYLPAAPEVDDPEETVNPDVRNVFKKYTKIN